MITLLGFIFLPDFPDQDLKCNISAVTSTPKSITTSDDQTLTCTVQGLDQNHPATLTWKDTDGAAVSTSDNTNYEMTQGTVDVTGKQDAVLTIKTTKLATFTSVTSVTFKCSVTSTQFTSSPSSTDVEVIAHIVTQRKCGIGCKYHHITGWPRINFRLISITEVTVKIPVFILEIPFSFLSRSPSTVIPRFTVPRLTIFPIYRASFLSPLIQALCVNQC